MEKREPQMGDFSYVLWSLLVTMLFKYPSGTCRLVYHKLWIRSPPFLQVVKEPPPYIF